MGNSCQYSLADKRVWVAGHRGMVGSALVRRLQEKQCEILTVDRANVDLRSSSDVSRWLDKNMPDTLFLAAAKVGGILANATMPADFLFDNLMIQANIIDAAFRARLGKVLILGSSCIYPRDAEQPIDESSLLTGPLEKTNEWYAIAKIAGIKLGQAYRLQHNVDFISAMPTNLYGPGDNFSLYTSHVIPALIRKAHEAKQEGRKSFEIWGTGTPLREFLHVDDCADALIYIMENYSELEHINVGSGFDLSIRELAETIAEVVGFQGQILSDVSKPDGTPRKLMNADKLKRLGWAPKIGLYEGLISVYEWFQSNEIRQ